MVHGTVRNSDDSKNAHLKSFEGASQNLQLFNADLLDYTTLTAAIEGCEGVFHVASPVPVTDVLDPQTEVIDPALSGTLNVLRACCEAKVRRVIYVSSIAAVLINTNWPPDKAKDEDCWSDKELCTTIQNWYCLSKTMAEEAAWSYAKENGLDMIALCPSICIGPLLQPIVNASSLFLICIVKGISEPLKDITWNFLDIRDFADALLLVYEKPEALGRLLEGGGGTLLSCGRLKALGWNHRPLEESVRDAVEYYQRAGLLDEGHSINVPPLFSI